MKFWFLGIGFYLISNLCEAQLANSSDKAVSFYELKAISKKNGAYYYGNTKITNWAALSIPFSELNDSEVNLRYRQYRTLNTAAQIVSWIPTVYFIANLNQEKNNRSQAYWGVLLTSLAGSMTCNLLAQRHIKRAISQYNSKISSKTSFQMSIEPDKNTWGIALQMKF
jgi:hypothetical protein